MKERSQVQKSSVPRWARGVKFRFDKARERWMIVAPERILLPQGPGLDISHHIDGERDVEKITDALLEAYDAERATIQTETIAFLQDLSDRGYITL